ncbi:MAG: hypothetical protein U0869_04110 [Chloroflexota bacterium]
MADAWGRGPGDPPLDDWHAALADALRANGFDPTPPSLGDDLEPELTPPPPPPSGWWADDELPPEPPRPAAPEPEPVVQAAPAVRPGLAFEPVTTPGPEGVAASQDPAPQAVVADAVPDVPVAAAAVVRAAPPAVPAGADSPRPPAFLAGRLGRGAPVAATAAAAATVAADERAAVPAEAAPGSAAAAASEIAPEALAASGPGAGEVAPDLMDAWAVAAAEPEPAMEPEPFAAPAIAELDDPAADPRAALAWPDPQPIDDERWPVAPVAPVADAPVWDAAAPAAGVAAAGFAFAHEADGDPAPVADPWAGVAFSAADAAAPGSEDVAAAEPEDAAWVDEDAPVLAVDEPFGDDELDALRAEAMTQLEAVPASDGSIDHDPDPHRAIAETAWGPAEVFDSSEPAPWDPPGSAAVAGAAGITQAEDTGASAVFTDPWADAPFDAAEVVQGDAADTSQDAAAAPLVDPWADAPFDAADLAAAAATPVVVDAATDHADPDAVAADPALAATAADAASDATGTADDRPWPPAGSTAWIIPEEVAPPVAAASTMPPVLTEDVPVDLDPGRIELIGYAEPAASSPGPAAPPLPDPVTAAATPAAATNPPPVIPSGTIADIGRRPPGARPVDPATLSTRHGGVPLAPDDADADATMVTAATVDGSPLEVPSASAPEVVAPAATGVAPAAAVAAASPGTSAISDQPAPGAVGGDLWDLVKAPTPPPAPEPMRGSKVVTLLLTLVVMLVIVALALGFVYMFTNLL